MALLAIHGLMRSGKDTVGTMIQYLMDYHSMGYKHPINSNDFISYVVNGHNLTSDWKIVKFADKLKEVAGLILGIDDFVELWDANEDDWRNTDLGDEWEHKYYTQVNQNKIVERYTPRTFVQTLGTDCGRNIIHPNIWVNATMSSYKSYSYASKDLGVGNGFEFKDEYPNWIITDVRFPNELESVTDRGGMVIHVDRDADRYSDMELHESETALDDYKFEHVIDNNGTFDELIHKVHEFLHNEKLIK